MKSKYLYIHDDTGEGRELTFYLVMIGSSVRDQQALRSLQRYAARYADYFQTYSGDRWEFVCRCIKSMFDSDDMVMIAQHVVKVTPEVLLRFLRGGAHPKNPAYVMRNAIRLQCFASIETRIGIEIAEKRARNRRDML